MNLINHLENYEAETPQVFPKDVEGVTWNFNHQKVEDVRDEWSDLYHESRREFYSRNSRRDYPILKGRGMSLIAVDADGERCGYGEAWELDNFSWKAVKQMIKANPTAAEIWLMGGLDAGQQIRDWEWGNYEPQVECYDLLIATKS